MYYENEKLNEIYRDTWPNLGWAKKPSKTTKKPIENNPKTDNEHRSP
jgi:hypothetical protein